MKAVFECPRCGNTNPIYIGYKDGKPYCRMCIGFKGAMATPSPNVPKPVRLSLGYRLSKDQKELSDKVMSNFDNGIDTLVYAVCGSGKTEISYGVIAKAMSEGKKVGFALPRRDVVIELFFRLKDAFPDNRIVAVYGQHSSTLTGDCIVLTTHQLYRYPNYFDLLVMDEIDAFPFKGNEVLIRFYKKALKGHCVMMSATPSKTILKEFSAPGHDILKLRTRFHKKPIPVPVIKIRPFFLKNFAMVSDLKRFVANKKQVFVFVPTVELSKKTYEFLSRFVKKGEFVSSKKPNRDQVISDFKKGRYSYLVTTAVLERGVTVKDLQVIVYGADNSIYDSAALIQIAGRVGRKKDAPSGEVIFYADRKTEEMEKAVREIEFCNRFL